jgi:hypothetical protein
MTPKEQHEYFSALGKTGGNNRWKGKSNKAKMAHMKKMAKLRHPKVSPQKTLKTP